jgi:Carboxypeptidase regulatory-like domain
MFTKFEIRRILSLAFVSASLTAAAFAQSATGTLEGTVTDPSGAAISGAHLHVTAETTGVTRDVTTNGSGLYSVTNLSAGRYSVKTSATGFASKSENDVVLSVGGVRDLDIALTVSSTDVTVNVESSANQVSVGDTSVQGVVDGKQTRDLPLNGRDWTSLATLNAGVSQVLTQYPGAASVRNSPSAATVRSRTATASTASTSTTTPTAALAP